MDGDESNVTIDSKASPGLPEQVMSEVKIEKVR